MSYILINFHYLIFKSQQWVCGKQRSKNCKARLVMNKNGALRITKNVYHNHAPEIMEGRQRAREERRETIETSKI